MNPVGYLETGVLYCDDNLERLPEFPDDCVDLIYLDPPFFSNRHYEVIWGDAGVLTCWLEQDYTFKGTKQHISAPTTVVFRRDNGAWKMVVFESIPLPLESP